MNAVFERDYVRTSMSGRYLLLRTGFALAIALMVVAQVLEGAMESDYASVGSQVLEYTVWAGLGLLFVAVPGSFGTSLVHARATNALPVLLATPLRPLEVAWGAFVARAAGYAVFVFACWPPVAIALAYGGVQPLQLLVASAVLIGTLLLLAAPAFVISAWARSTGAAVVAAYLASASSLAGLGALGEQLAVTGNPLLACAVSPIHALSAAIEPTRLGVDGGAAGGWLLLLGGIAASLGAVLLATWRMRREASGELEAAVEATAQRGYRPMRHENPILDRELRTGGSLRTRSTGRTLLWTLVLSEVAYLVAVWTTSATQAPPGAAGPAAAAAQLSIPLFAGFLIFQTSVLVLAAAAAGATSLASEKESGGLEVIRVTRIPAREIVEGKLLGLFRALAPSLAVPVVHLAWGASRGLVHWLAVPAFVVSGAVVSATWVVVGMQQSLDQRDPHKAVLRTMSLLAILGGLVAFYAGVGLYALTDDVEDWTQRALSGGANPVGAILTWVAALRTGGSDAQSTNLAPPTTGDTVAGLVAGALWLGVHVLGAWAVFKRLAHHYRTRFEG